MTPGRALLAYIVAVRSRSLVKVDQKAFVTDDEDWSVLLDDEPPLAFSGRVPSSDISQREPRTTGHGLSTHNRGLAQDC
jgi:hypothetical protein